MRARGEHVVAGSLFGASLALIACAQPSPPVLARIGPQADVKALDPRPRLERLALRKDAALPPDPTNRFADDPRAAALGQKLFFDTRFSGQLLDSANDGTAGTLGKSGETGKVACASCHIPNNRAFVDTRSPRNQLSLAASWTHRKAPSLLDVGGSKSLMWDGRHDTFFGLVFTPIESALEFNSSRLFVAKQIQRLYRGEYERIFGPMPALAEYPELDPSDAGCTKLPRNADAHVCQKPGHDAEPVLGVIVNFGKAIQAYLRRLSCGRSRFDAWLDGASTALTAREQAGAVLFVGKGGCDACHSGPLLTDHAFHNVGLRGALIPFTGIHSGKDPGAEKGLAKLLSDPMNSAGRYSDGDDGRLKAIARNQSPRLGAFRTPSLRCVSRRPSFMHDGQFRVLEDVVRFFSEGGAKKGFLGTSENQPRNLSKQEMQDLVAFLKALDGSGPDSALVKPPVLP